MCYEYDEYFEPCEFDIEIGELKNKIRQSVKKEITEELERLREENRELQGIKSDFEGVREKYKQKEVELDKAISQAEINAKRTKLKELFEQYKLTMFSVRSKRYYIKKCNKCDSFRRIKIKLPSGKEVYDVCECNNSAVVYIPNENIIYELSDKIGNIKVWYAEVEDGYFVADKTPFISKKIVNHDVKFEDLFENLNDVKLYGIFFTTYEECKDFCDYINGAEVLGYDYNVDGQLVTQREEIG